MPFLSEQKVSTLKLFTSVFWLNLSDSYKPWKTWPNMALLKIRKKPHAPHFSKRFFKMRDVARDLPGIKYKDD
jgi:hypothetical protein